MSVAPSAASRSGRTGLFALAHRRSTLVGVSSPWSVVRSMHVMARSSHAACHSFLTVRRVGRLAWRRGLVGVGGGGGGGGGGRPFGAFLARGGSRSLLRPLAAIRPVPARARFPRGDRAWGRGGGGGGGGGGRRGDWGGRP